MSKKRMSNADLAARIEKQWEEYWEAERQAAQQPSPVKQSEPIQQPEPVEHAKQPTATTPLAAISQLMKHTSTAVDELRKQPQAEVTTSHVDCKGEPIPPDAKPKRPEAKRWDPIKWARGHEARKAKRNRDAETGGVIRRSRWGEV